MNTAYLSLGSNEGNREQWLEKAITLLGELCGTVAKKSSIYETAAWGLEEQAAFLNMAVCLYTNKQPSELLQAVHQIENTLGRQRHIKWGPRTLDIDILLYNNDIIDLPELKIPHPFISVRRFVLAPLAEIAPAYIHPLLQKTINDLLTICPDTLEVHKYMQQ